MKLRTLVRSAVCLLSATVALGVLPSQLKAQSIQVTSATPNTAAQGTINLNVTVGGNGFKRGAQAAWFVTGTTNPGGVTVNSTAFNSSGQLTANITVADSADLSSYDIVVTNADGRSGKGTKLFSVTSGNGAKSNPCSSDVNVTTLIADTDSGSNPFQLQSDGMGAYSTYTQSKSDSLISEMQGGSCDWLFDTTNSASRAVTLTLLYPASTPAASPFTNPTPIRSRFISLCNSHGFSNNGVTYGSMTFTGQTLECGLRAADITYNGKSYALVFNPNTYAGTTALQVTCTGAVSSQCNSWTTTPIPNSAPNPITGQPTAIAELVQVSTAKGKTIETPLGLYYVAFSVTIHE
jgi:hypothetical protein